MARVEESRPEAGMRVLYGVVGDGMGHATRSRVVLEHLANRGHDIEVLASSRAFGFLCEVFVDAANVAVTEIAGLHMEYDDNRVRRWATAKATLTEAPEGLRRNANVWRRVMGGARPEVVLTDFDTFSYVIGRALRVPVICVDNNHVLDRCRHDRAMREGVATDFAVARAVVKGRLPRAYHYLVSTFFFPPVAKRRTTLVPPVLRPAVLATRREPGEHLLVYQTAAGNRALVPALQRLPFECRVYGTGREGREGNVLQRPFSQTTFLEDLRTARAAIAGGGYSFMSEAVHLHVPLLSIPLRGQYEQELNARYLERLGYGLHAEQVSEDVLQRFLARVPDCARALERYRPRDNAYLLTCVDELLERVARGAPPPDALDTALAGPC